MKDEMTKVKLTIHIPFDKPNKNGTVFTKEAIENAINNAPINIPIVHRDNKSEFNNKVIGTTTDNLYIAAWDSENQLCKMIANGIVFHSNADIIINKIEDGVISDFRITDIGLTI